MVNALIAQITQFQTNLNNPVSLHFAQAEINLLNLVGANYAQILQFQIIHEKIVFDQDAQQTATLIA